MQAGPERTLLMRQCSDEVMVPFPEADADTQCLRGVLQQSRGKGFRADVLRSDRSDVAAPTDRRQSGRNRNLQF